MIEIITLQERIEQGSAAILKARAEGKDTTEWEKHLAELKNRLLGLLDSIRGIKLVEFEKQDYSIEVFSEVLGSTVWFCSNAAMAAQVKIEAPGAVCYTVSELREIIKLNPGSKSLRGIHTAKEVFGGSIIKSDPIEEMKNC